MKLLHPLTSLLTATAVLAHPKPPTSNRALYFLDSDPEGASVISLKIADDGKISDPKRTSTGGKGLISNNTDGRVDVDPLFSQDSVVVSGSRLFTVNAGSNTLAVFEIPEHDPSHPVLLGEPVSTVGDVPNTVAFSPKNKLACVANTGTKDGVQCFSVSDCGFVQAVGPLMPLPLNQTVPPVGPVATASDIVFNPSETALFVVVKGDGMNKGYIYVYPIVDGKVQEKPVVSRPDDIMVPFSLSFMSDSTAVMSDAAYGAAYIDIAKDWTIKVTDKVEIPKQGATCWSVYSESFNAVFLFDVMSPDVHTLDPETGNTEYIISGNPKSDGAVDSKIERSSLYTLQSVPAIAVAGLAGCGNGKKTPEIVQYLDLSHLGSRDGWTGMAVYPSA